MKPPGPIETIRGIEDAGKLGQCRAEKLRVSVVFGQSFDVVI